jgi:hypothetical protein
MSVAWGFYSVAFVFELLFYWPVQILPLLGGSCIFVVGGYATRFINFRTKPTLITVAVASIVLCCIGFAVTKPTLVGCSPL